MPENILADTAIETTTKLCNNDKQNIGNEMLQTTENKLPEDNNIIEYSTRFGPSNSDSTNCYSHTAISPSCTPATLALTGTHEELSSLTDLQPYSQMSFLPYNSCNDIVSSVYNITPELNSLWSAALPRQWSSFAAAHAAAAAGAAAAAAAISNDVCNDEGSAPSFSYIDSLSATSETYAASLFNPLPHCSQFLRYGENAVPTAVEQQRTSHNVDFQSPVLHKSGVFSQEPQLVADNFTSSDKVDALELGAGCYLLDQFPALERSPPQLNYSNCLFDETNKFSPVLSAAAAAAAAFMTRNSVNTTVSNNYSSDGTEVTLMRTQQNTRRGGGRKPREIEQETMEILNDEDKDKKAKRRQRNKEAAARCRKRRLDHMNSLQKQVDRLKEENNEKQNTIEHLRREKINLLNLLEHNHCLLPKDINDMNMHRRLASHLELPMLHSTPQQSIMHSLAPSPVTRCESSVSPNGTSGSAYPMSSSVPVAGSFTGNTNDNMLMSSMSSGMPAMYSQLQLNSTSNSIAGTAPSSASSSMSNTSVLSSSSSSNGCHGEDENSSPTGFVISHSNQAVAGNENCLDDSSSRLINGSTFKEELNISSSSPDDVLLRQFNDSTICSMLTDDDPAHNWSLRILVISEAAYDQQVEKQKMDDTYSRRPTSLLLGQSPFDFNFTTINTPSTGLTTPGMFNVSNEYTFLTQRTMFTPIINGPMILRTSNSPSHSGELRQL